MKKKRKATPKQMAALKKARAALKKKYGTSDISKISGRRGGSSRRRSAAAATAAAEEENEMAALEENPSRKKSTKKRATKKRATKKRATKRRTKASSRRTTRGMAAKQTTTKRRRLRKSTTHTTAGKVHIVRLPRAPQVKVIRIEEKKRRRRRRKSTSAHRMELALLENPPSLGVTQSSLGGYGVLFENPTGPFSASSLKSYGWASGGVAFGLTLARLADRYVATRTPADSGNLSGNNPRYGRAAAAAFNRRPDAMRMGVQAAGAIAAIGGAYAVRHRSLAPWALGGIALGFGANLLLQVAEWFIMPQIFVVDDVSEESFANRVYPLEQKDIQDTVDDMFEAWDGVPSLAEGQQEKPIIRGPLSSEPGSTYTLGAPQWRNESAAPLSGAVGGLIPTGRVGECSSCGGRGGCYKGCPGLNQGCTDCGGRLCAYRVQYGDSLSALAAAAGVDPRSVDALNGGSETSYWVVGREVVLPYKLCMYLSNDGSGTVGQRPPSGDDTGPIVTSETPPGGTQSVTVVNKSSSGVGGVGPYARVDPTTTLFGTAGHEEKNKEVPLAVQVTPKKRPFYVPNFDDE